MKCFTLGLAAATVGLLSTAGCSAPATPTAETSATTAPTTTMAPATSEPTSAPTVKPVAAKIGPTLPSIKADPKAKADPKYRVVAADAKFGGGAPPQMVAAQKAVQVPPPPLSFKVPAKPRVVLDTSKGPITVELDAKAAPLQVKSFVYLSRLGFFDGTVFHRHADLLGDGTGFIIQGGDPFTKNPSNAQMAGTGGPGYEIPRERNSLKHEKLVIAAARSSDPNSAGSQFYITQGPVTFLDQGDGYTVFGKVVGGQDAALQLSQDDTLKSAKVLK